MKNQKIKKILNKKGKSPITCLTSYTKPIAKIVDKYCDLILIGDSVGTVFYGMKTTKKVNIETIYSKENYITNYRIILDSFKILIIFFKIIVNIKRKNKKIHK